MVFKRDDIYTSSGSTMLYNSWTPYVSKYDTSSFYNWEQDNLPLYDLEERTYELWEQAGFPTSSIPGLALVVSGAAPQAVLDANNNVFTTVSACIAALPKVIRFPVLIEICNTGDMGLLELHDFKIEERGSIEIINRAYTRMYQASSLGAAFSVPGFNPPTANTSHYFLDTLSGLDFTEGFNIASSLILSSKIFNNMASALDPVMSSINTFALVRPGNTSVKSPITGAFKNTKSEFVSWQTAGAWALGFNYTYLVIPEEIDPVNPDNTFSIYDVSAKDQYDNLDIARVDIANYDIIGMVAAFANGALMERVTGSMYFNNLSKISVKNCNGPIYIRNFCVFGNSQANKIGTDNGIEVLNSNVVLENCGVARCREAGFKIENSQVIISRSAFSYRNYELVTTTTRTEKKGLGFHGVNSDIIFSSIISGTSEIGAGDWDASGNDVVFAASRNYGGMRFDSCRLSGGLQRTSLTNEISYGTIISELNSGYGIELNNSIADLKGLIDVYENKKGILLNNSTLKFDELCSEFHTEEGILANNSNIIWDAVANPTSVGQAARAQLQLRFNGQNMVLHNSKATFERSTNNLTKFGSAKILANHGTIKGEGTYNAPLPSIHVNDNSKAELIHPIIVNIANYVTSGIPAFGLAAKVDNNSELELFGTASGCSLVWGPADKTKKLAGIYANNGSVISLHGPTVIAQYDVDLLAENNSTINIEPPRLQDGYSLDISGFQLGSTSNHTSVELHSTRACIVVDKNSTLNLKDLGSFLNFWPSTSAGAGVLTSGVDLPASVYDNSAYIAAGSLQFYPNPQDDATLHVLNLDNLFANTMPVGNVNALVALPVVFTNNSKINTFIVKDNPVGGSPNYTDRAKVTQGGVCVRALGGSIINVNNVHFPLGTNNTPLDGVYYNVSATDCDKLMIWNLADDSKLNASYLSVSGMYPLAAQWHGPSALWVSSDGATGYRIASGAPISTPHTGPLSILDSFGAGSSVWILTSGTTINSETGFPVPIYSTPDGNTSKFYASQGIVVSGAGTIYPYGAPVGTSLNKGPFRIYFSTHSSARLLQTDLSGYNYGSFPHTGNFSGALGVAHQIFAQGYNCSAPLSAIIPTGYSNASSIYPNLLKLSVDTNGDGIANALWTSGFYYCLEFVEDDPTQCMLDESAAETFANAKNASWGSSGRPRKVTIYRARGADILGSEAHQGTAQGSVGFKSTNIFDLTRDN